MYDYLPIAMLCISVIVLAALLALVVILSKPKKKRTETVPKEPAGNTGPVRKNWQGWILFFGIALILAIWTFWGALFFLSVVWVMRRNPKPDSIHTVGDDQKKTAKRIYGWLFWSPIFTVPFFIMMAAQLSWDHSSTNERFLTALVPLLLHVPLFLGFTSQSAFVYRHTQQGILLIALRAGMAGLAVSIGQYLGDGLWLFLLGNGALWLFGTLWGRSQVVRGECWWMKRKGEGIILIEGGLPHLAPQRHLEKSREFIHQFKKDDATQHALAAFRTGDHDIRMQAVQVLDVLEEVEKF